jgi:hypothetical protein
MFFICGALKFPECIFYFLVYHVYYLFHEFLSDLFYDFLFGRLFEESLGSLVTFIAVLLGSATGYPFGSFPSKSSIPFF